MPLRKQFEKPLLAKSNVYTILYRIALEILALIFQVAYFLQVPY